MVMTHTNLLSLRIAAVATIFLLGCSHRVTEATQPGREVIVVFLKADADGGLATIQIDANNHITGADMLQQLQQLVIRAFKIARDAGQEEPEIALRIDDRLQFRELARVLVAITKTTDGGKVIPLATSVRLQTQDVTTIEWNQEYLNYLEARSKDRLVLGFDTPPFPARERPATKK